MRIIRTGNNVRHNPTRRGSDMPNLSIRTGSWSQIMSIHVASVPNQATFGARAGSQTFPEFNSPSEILFSKEILLAKPTTATEWMQQNKPKVTKKAGKYVAITHRGIIATSDDFDDIYAKARKQGIMNPLVFKVPKVASRTKIVSVKSL